MLRGLSAVPTAYLLVPVLGEAQDPWKMGPFRLGANTSFSL